MKVTTKMDSEVELAFFAHTAKRLYKIIFGCVSLIATLGLIFIFARKDIPVGLFCVSVSCILAFVFPYKIKTSYRGILEAYKNGKETKVIEFDFKGNYFEKKVFSNQQQVEFSKCYYDKIFKVEQTKDYFFIYTSNSWANCIVKRNMSDSEIIKLENIFKDRNVKCKVRK
jgi:hypothetical protein